MDQAQVYGFFATSQGGYHPQLEPTISTILFLRELVLSSYIFQDYIGDLVASRLHSFDNSLKIFQVSTS